MSAVHDYGQACRPDDSLRATATGARERVNGRVNLKVHATAQEASVVVSQAEQMTIHIVGWSWLCPNLQPSHETAVDASCGMHFKGWQHEIVISPLFYFWQCGNLLLF